MTATLVKQDTASLADEFVSALREDVAGETANLIAGLKDEGTRKGTLTILHTAVMRGTATVYVIRSIGAYAMVTAGVPQAEIVETLGVSQGQVSKYGLAGRTLATGVEIDSNTLQAGVTTGMKAIRAAVSNVSNADTPKAQEGARRQLVKVITDAAKVKRTAPAKASKKTRTTDSPASPLHVFINAAKGLSAADVADLKPGELRAFRGAVTHVSRLSAAIPAKPAAVKAAK